MQFNFIPTLQPETANHLKEGLLNQIVLGIAVMALPAGLLSISRTFQIGWRPVFVVHIVTKQAPARTKLQLVKTASHHLRRVQKQPERIRRYFQHDPVKYAA